MRRFAGLVLALTCLSSSADEPKKAEAKKKTIGEEMERFAGTWEVVTKGATGPARKVVFKKGGTYATYDDKGQFLWKGTFDLDPTAEPKVWDHREQDEPKKTGRDILGIYELDRDRLKVCVTIGRWKDGKWEGEPRPKEFKATKDYAVIEFERVEDMKK